MAADPQALVRRYDQLYGDQANWRTTWQNLAEFFTPYKANITVERTPGTQKTQRLFDSEGVTAATTLSSNIQGSVANPAQDWFSVKVRQADVNEQKPVRDWCEAVTKRTLAALSNSNFYTELSEVFVDLPVFCTAGLYCDERAPLAANRFGGLHYCALVIGRYVIAENADGRVDTVYRSFELPAREVFAKWPHTCSQSVKDRGRPDGTKLDDPVKILHAVYPRVGPRKRNEKAFASCYLEHNPKTLLGEGGYEENPYAVARWSKDSQSAYGWGPGAIAYPDVRTLNRWVEIMLGAGAKATDPPLLQRHEAILGSLSLEPAAINVAMTDGPLNDAVTPLESKARFDVTQVNLERLERKISEVFYGPLLRQITKDMTATEAWIVQDETMRLLGPAAGRIQTELLSSVIERTIAILYRAGEFPPIPQEMAQGFDVDLDIVYEGALARAQRSRDLVAIQRKNAWVVEVLPFKPEVVDNYDWDAEARLVAEVTGYPSDLVKGEDQVAAIRDGRAQQQAAAAKLQLVAGAAQAAGQAAPMVTAISKAQEGQVQPAQGQAA